MKNKQVIVIISDPFEFISERNPTNILEGEIILENDSNTGILVQLNKENYFKKQAFCKLICKTRYVDQKFHLIDSEEEASPCNIIGIPDAVFNANDPFNDSESMLYMIGSIQMRKPALAYLRKFNKS